MGPVEIGSSRSQRAIQIFLTGVVAILPLALTVIVLAWLVGLVHDLAGPTSMCGKVLRSVGMSVTACDVTAYIIGIVAALVLVFGLGAIIERGAARRWGQTFDTVMHKIPVLGTVYDASKQVTSIFDRKPDARQSMTPVMCYFGDDHNAGTPALMPTAELVHIDGKDYHIVIIPTAPVPFGGALVCVRADWVRPAACGFEELVGVYMSMGVTAPRSLGQTPDISPSPSPSGRGPG